MNISLFSVASVLALVNRRCRRNTAYKRVSFLVSGAFLLAPVVWWSVSGFLASSVLKTSIGHPPVIRAQSPVCGFLASLTSSPVDGFLGHFIGPLPGFLTSPVCDSSTNFLNIKWATATLSLMRTISQAKMGMLLLSYSSMSTLPQLWR